MDVQFLIFIYRYLFLLVTFSHVKFFCVAILSHFQVSIDSQILMLFLLFFFHEIFILFFKSCVK